MVFSLVPINYSYEDYKIDRRPPKRIVGDSGIGVPRRRGGNPPAGPSVITNGAPATHGGGR